MQSPHSVTRKINQYRYLQQDVIGQGASGKVYLGINTLTNQRVAIKTINMDTIDNEVTRYLLDSEKKALANVKSPYVLHAIEIIQDNQFCYLITEYFQGGTLKQKIAAKKNQKKATTVFQEIQALEILLKLVQGLCAIHEKGFVHRDLKTANILFRGKDPVIIDFGYCDNQKGNKPQMYYNVGSPSYMSPQAYKKCQYSSKSDVWALGVIFYQMLIGVPLDYGIQIKEFFTEIQKPGGLNFASGISKASQSLLALMLKNNARERISPLQLLKPIQISLQGLNSKHNFSAQNIFYKPAIRPTFKVQKRDNYGDRVNQSLLHSKEFERSEQSIHQRSFDGLSGNTRQSVPKKYICKQQNPGQDPYQQRIVHQNNQRINIIANFFQTKQKPGQRFKPQTSNQYQIQRFQNQNNNANRSSNRVFQSLSPKMGFSVSPKKRNEVAKTKLQIQTRFQNQIQRQCFKNGPGQQNAFSRQKKLHQVFQNKTPIQQFNSVFRDSSNQRKQQVPAQSLIQKMRVCSSKPDLQFQQRSNRQINKKSQMGVMFQSDIIAINNRNNQQLIRFKPWQMNRQAKTGGNFIGANSGRLSLQNFPKNQKQPFIDIVILSKEEEQKRLKMLELRHTVNQNASKYQNPNNFINNSYPYHYFASNQQEIRKSTTEIAQKPSFAQVTPAAKFSNIQNVNIHFNQPSQNNFHRPDLGAIQPISNKVQTMQMNPPFKVTTNQPQNYQSLIIKKPGFLMSVNQKNEEGHKNIITPIQKVHPVQQPKQFITITTQNKNSYKFFEQNGRVPNNNIRI